MYVCTTYLFIFNISAINCVMWSCIPITEEMPLTLEEQRRRRRQQRRREHGPSDNKNKSLMDMLTAVAAAAAASVVGRRWAWGNRREQCKTLLLIGLKHKNANNNTNLISAATSSSLSQRLYASTCVCVFVSLLQ